MLLDTITNETNTNYINQILVLNRFHPKVKDLNIIK